MDRDFSCLCLEDKALDADDVTDVEQFLEHDVVQIFVFLGADVVAGDVHLDASLAVLRLNETGLAHDAAAHHATGDGHVELLVIVEIGLDVFRPVCYGVFCGRIGIDAHVAQLLQALATADLLLTQF